MKKRWCGSTHSHVGLAPDVGFCERLFELARDAEIAELDLTLSVDEDVGGLDVWVGSVRDGTRVAGLTAMDDLELVFEELEAADHGAGDAGEDVFGDTGSEEFVEGAGVHVLHAVVDAGLDEEGAVELDDLGGDGAVEDVELHDDGVEFCVVEFEPDFL